MVCCRLDRVWRARNLAVAALAGTALLLSASTLASAATKSGRGGKREEATHARPAGTPFMAVVSINQQRVTVYDADGPMLRSPVSTGKRGYETPVGIYSVLQKKVEHYSNIYYDAAMPYMQRLTWSGIALHGGALPGYPASGGCIRMPIGFAKRLFGQTKLGTRVIVVRDDISPADIIHPALFKPWSGQFETVTAGLSPGEGLDGADKSSTAMVDAPVATDVPPARQRQSLRSVAADKAAKAAAAAKEAEQARRAAAQARVAIRRLAGTLRRAKAAKARAAGRARRAERLADAAEPETPDAAAAQEAKSKGLAALAEAQAQLEAVEAQVQTARELAVQRREEAKAAHAARAAAREEAEEAADKLLPVSVFISRKTQRLYVRQAREPLFESPVTITDADDPLGTYVFTAVAYANAQTELRWSVISMYRSARGPSAQSGKRKRGAAAAATDLAGAKLALDRIAIPKEAVDRISEVVTPGSSLIISDEGISRETGKGTGFIIVMSNEPQGGIKIRRHRPKPGYRYRRRFNDAPHGWSAPPFVWQ